MMMQIETDKIIAASGQGNLPRKDKIAHKMQTSDSLEGGDQEFNGATARKTQKLDNLGQEMRMQTLCREEEDGEDLDTDGRQLGIGLVLDLDVIEELQMQT